MSKLKDKEIARDEVAEGVEEALQKLKDHARGVLLAGGAFLLVVVTIVGYRAYRDGIREKTSAILNNATVLFNELPGMKNEEERKTRIEATITALGSLVTQYPDSEASRQALYLQGNCHYYLDQLDKARESYQKFIESAREAEDKARGEIAVGFTHENRFFLEEANAKLLEEAQVHYGLAEKLAPKDSYVYYYALLNQARVLELRFKDQEALDIYKRIMKERPIPKAEPTDKEKKDKDKDTSTLAGAVNKMLEGKLDPLSIYSTAKLRAERLEATSTIIKPATSGS